MRETREKARLRSYYEENNGKSEGKRDPEDSKQNCSTGRGKAQIGSPEEK